ncbi:MAG: methytransferase partner Trm112 [Archaeoglobaceae archaeon]
MRRSLLDILACPKCKSDLELEVLEEENGEIISGKLICKACGVYYPIEDGIPNLLPGL